MTKQEFLEKLRLALNGKVTPGQLAENLRYYEDYINTEIRKGRGEDEVLSALGDPRLIARTIVETGGGSGAFGDYEESGGGDGNGWSEEETPTGRRTGGGIPGLLFRVPLWGWLVIAILILVLVLSFVFSVIAAILPVLLPILLVVFLVKLFRDWIS